MIYQLRKRNKSFDFSEMKNIPKKFHQFVTINKDSFSIQTSITQKCSFVAEDISVFLRSKSSWSIIFCRNVLIYYTKTQTFNIIKEVVKKLQNPGYLCIGHCDSIESKGTGLIPLGNSIFKPAIKSNEQTGHREGGVVLIVDDEPDIAHLVASSFEETVFKTVVYYDSRKALQYVKEQHATISLMIFDYKMPYMNGLALASESRNFLRDVPFFLMSGFPSQDLFARSSALGIEEFISKPFEKGKLNSLVERYTKPKVNVSNHDYRRHKKKGLVDVILIGASTGGPEALHELLHELPADLPPLIVVQHIVDGFEKGFGQRLAQNADMRYVPIDRKIPIENGVLYLPCGDSHSLLTVEKGSLMVEPSQAAKVHSHRPSIDVLFNSAATIRGLRPLAILLTGMGKDGADGLFNLRMRTKARTAAQDEESCVVYGMPKAAIENGSAEFIGSPEEIRRYLIGLTSSEKI